MGIIQWVLLHNRYYSKRLRLSRNKVYREPSKFKLVRSCARFDGNRIYESAAYAPRFRVTFTVWWYNHAFVN